MTIYSNDDMTYEFPSSGVCDGGGGVSLLPNCFRLGRRWNTLLQFKKKHFRRSYTLLDFVQPIKTKY